MKEFIDLFTAYPVWTSIGIACVINYVFLVVTRVLEL
jgi:hypothetical protein